MNQSEIAEALEGVRKTGPLTPSRVVRTAKNPASTLHPLFEWDDARAGHQYRLAQARSLISTRVITVPQTGRVIRAYLHVPARVGEGEYLPVAVVVRQPDKLTLTRDATLRALASAQANLDELDEAVRAFGTADRRAEQGERAARARALVEDARLQLVGI